jgi:hypothetical protein
MVPQLPFTHMRPLQQSLGTLQLAPLMPQLIPTQVPALQVSVPQQSLELRQLAFIGAQPGVARSGLPATPRSAPAGGGERVGCARSGRLGSGRDPGGRQYPPMQV